MQASTQTTMAMVMAMIAENTASVQACGSTRMAIMMTAKTTLATHLLRAGRVTTMTAALATAASGTCGTMPRASGWSAGRSTRAVLGLRALPCGSSWRAVVGVQEEAVPRGIRFSASSVAMMRRLLLLLLLPHQHRPRKARAIQAVQLRLRAEPMLRLREALQQLLGAAAARSIQRQLCRLILTASVLPLQGCCCGHWSHPSSLPWAGRWPLLAELQPVLRVAGTGTSLARARKQAAALMQLQRLRVMQRQLQEKGRLKLLAVEPAVAVMDCCPAARTASLCTHWRARIAAMTTITMTIIITMTTTPPSLASTLLMRPAP